MQILTCLLAPALLPTLPCEVLLQEDVQASSASYEYRQRGCGIV